MTIASSIVITANSDSAILVGTSQTLVPGGQAVTTAGNVISLASSGGDLEVNGQTTQIPGPATQQTPAPLAVTVGSALVENSESAFVLDGSQTLASGGSAVTVGGTTYSLGSAGNSLVVDRQTTMLQQAQVSALPTLTIGDALVTANSESQYVIGGTQTLAAGGSAITVSGTTYSLGTSGAALVVDGQTTSLQQAQVSALPTLTVGDALVTANSESEYIVDGTRTLVPGGPAVTYQGTTYSVASTGSAVYVNGQMTNPQAAQTTGPIVIGSETLQPGGSAVVVSGTTYSVVTSGTALVVNGQTTSIASTSDSNALSTGLVTVGSTQYTYTQLSQGGDLVIGSQTLSPGGPAATIAGQQVSLATDGVLDVNGTPRQTLQAASMSEASSRNGVSATNDVSPASQTTSASNSAAPLSRLPAACSGAIAVMLALFILSIY